jgi:hypothetical protein
MTAPALASVTAWGELRGDRNLPGALRVLVAGQAAGGAERVGEAWRASWHSAAYKDRCTEHATADEAVRAVVRSGWARHLGARAGSAVYWSDKAWRLAGAPALAGAR